MELLFWMIIIAWVIFAGVGTRVSALAPYTWWPGIVLFVILGYKVMGWPH